MMEGPNVTMIQMHGLISEVCNYGVSIEGNIRGDM